MTINNYQKSMFLYEIKKFKRSNKTKKDFFEHILIKKAVVYIITRVVLQNI